MGSWREERLRLADAGEFGRSEGQKVGRQRPDNERLREWEAGGQEEGTRSWEIGGGGVEAGGARWTGSLGRGQILGGWEHDSWRRLEEAGGQKGDQKTRK